MVLEHSLEFIRTNSDKFGLTIYENNQPTWTDYVEQYRYVISLLTDKGKEKTYSINPISRPFLFLVRHYFELLLKNELNRQNISLLHTHNFREIIKQYDDNDIIIPNEVKDAISIIDFDEDGACYRYYKNLDGNVYLRDNNIIEAYRVFEIYQKLPLSSLFYQELTSISEFDKALSWEFTCHMHEITTQAQIRTQYDCVISYIIKLIADGTVDVSRIYLPLMFLIRHSIELALKDNAINILIIETDTVKKEKIEKQIKRAHRLSRLYNIFKKYLSLVSLDNADRKFKTQTTDFYEKTERLMDIVHTLDSNSRQFRYIPENSKITIKKDTLVEALDLYTFTDPFLTFVIGVFKENGIIHDSDKELAKMFGYE